MDGAPPAEVAGGGAPADTDERGTDADGSSVSVETTPLEVVYDLIVLVERVLFPVVPVKVLIVATETGGRSCEAPSWVSSTIVTSVEGVAWKVDSIVLAELAILTTSSGTLAKSAVYTLM